MATIREGKSVWPCRHLACDKEFAVKSGLQRHRKAVHEGRRHWICAEPGCGKAFRDQKNMAVHHATVHEGRRDFLCSEAGCGSAFGRSSHLADHRRTVHEGRRDFLCAAPGCRSAFARRSHLLIHQQSVHDRRRDWKCVAHCGRVFNARRSLLRHQRGNSCQSGAPSQQKATALPQLKRTVDDGTPLPPPSGVSPHKRPRPLTPTEPHSQKAVLVGNVGALHPVSRQRTVLPGGSDAAAPRAALTFFAPPLGDASRALAASLAPASVVTRPLPRGRCLSDFAHDALSQGSMPALNSGARAVHMESAAMNQQGRPVLKSSRVLEMPPILSYAFTQEPPSNSPVGPRKSTVCPLRDIVCLKSRFFAPAGVKYSRRGVRHGEKTNFARQRWDAELVVAPEKLEDVGGILAHASGDGIETTSERIQGRGGHFNDARHRRHRGGYGGSHSQEQDVSLQYGNLRGGSGSEMRGGGGQYARCDLFNLDANYYDSCRSDVVRGKPQARIGSRANTFRQKDEHQAHQYDHVGKLQNCRSLGLMNSRFYWCQRASPNERKSGAEKPICGADFLSASNYGKTGTVVPAPRPIPDFSTAFRPILLTITRAQRSFPNSI